MPHSHNPQTAVELHGWDPATASWHGPDELHHSLTGCRAILSKLRAAGGTWYGPLKTQLPGEPALSVWASTRDLEDAGLATLDLEGSSGGPLQTILIVPSQRRGHLRADLAFEFVSHLRFLEGRESTGSEMAIHDYVESALRQSDPSKTLVFSVESRFVLAETRIALCEVTDRLVSGMVAWLTERDSARANSMLIA